MNKNIFFGLISLVILAGCVSGPGYTGTGQSATNVYMKDATDTEVKAVTVTVTKVEMRDVNGEFHTVFQGNSQVRLEEGTVRHVASSQVESSTYTAVRMEFADNATVEKRDGSTYTAHVEKQQIVVETQSKDDSEVSSNETAHIVVDISIRDSVKTETNGEATFHADQDAKSEMWIESGTQIDSTVNSSTTAKIVVDTSIINNIKVNTNLGVGLSMN